MYEVRIGFASSSGLERPRPMTSRSDVELEFAFELAASGFASDDAEESLDSDIGMDDASSFFFRRSAVPLAFSANSLGK